VLHISNRKTRRYPAFVSSVIVLFLGLIAVRGGGYAVGNEASLAERVQRIEDDKQIRDLMVQYGQYLDTLDFARYSQLFAKEGEWSGLLDGFTTIKSPENIRAAMEKAFAKRTYNPEHVTNLHLITNAKIDIDGDRATGYSRWTVLSRNESGEPYVRLTGRYDDIFIREDGRWKFLSRIARREIP
jgi:hypothetical protein